MRDIDTLLQEQLAALEAGRALEDLLSDLTDAERAEIEGLLRLASAVRRIPHPLPVVEQAAGRRAQIMAAAEVHTRPLRQQQPQRARLPWAWLGGGLAFGTLAAAALCLGLALLLGAGLMFGGQRQASARIEDLRGQVQVAESAESEVWVNADAGTQVRQGQRLRTLGASSATVVYFDGTRTHIGANAEMTFLVLESRGRTGLRVELDQHSGQTSHQVVPLKGVGSFFRVVTPAGQASVHGTSFQVHVDPDGKSEFAVDTGEVRVRSAGGQVTLRPGQVTLAGPGQPPASPNYRFRATGSLLDNEGSLWAVSGVTFAVDEQTQLGDGLDLGGTVTVTGRTLDSGQRVADRVTRSDDAVQATVFTGILESMQGDTWLVSSTPLTVTAGTLLAEGLRAGAPVEVTANILNDGSWLALQILALQECPAGQSPTATLTPNREAMPSLSFEPDEREQNTCGSASASLSGSLRNTGLAGKDTAANVELGYLIERGGAYVDTVTLTPGSWVSIDGQQAVTYTASITLNEAWAAAGGAEVKLRVFVAAETNRPGHHRGRATLTLTNRCDTATPPAAVTPAPTQESSTPAAEPTPVQATATAVPTPAAGGSCTGADPHPTGMTLAQRYGVSYAEIMGWFCQNYGFGEIDLAYSLSRQSGLPVEQVFAMRASGMGWGEIKKQLAPDDDKPANENRGNSKDKDEKNNSNNKKPKKTPGPPQRNR